MHLTDPEIHENPSTFERADRSAQCTSSNFTYSPTLLEPDRDAGALPSLARGIQNFLGATLSGIGVVVQTGNVLICLSLLLFGPAVLLGFLHI